MRFLTTTQLARLAFQGSRWAASKRLRKLLDAGLVRAWVRNLAEENVYSLDRAGARALEAQDGDGGPRAVPRGLDGNLDHLLAINRVRISLALGLAEAGGEIRWWRSDWELRAHGRQRVIPDALFEVQWDGAEDQTFVLEVDNQTRSSQAFLKKTLKYGAVRYRGQGIYGVNDFVTLVVGRDPEWVERYRVSLARTHLGFQTWFTTLQAVEEKGAVGLIWKSVNMQEHYSLRDLVSLPYGKEGGVPRRPTPTGS